jgi:prefoldin subunit 5
MAASIKAGAAGKAFAMSTDDPQEALERTADELEERTERLSEHLDEARDKLEERAAEARRLGEAEDVAGDWQDADDQAGGEDPEGAGS